MKHFKNLHINITIARVYWKKVQGMTESFYQIALSDEI